MNNKSIERDVWNSSDLIDYFLEQKIIIVTIVVLGLLLSIFYSFSLPNIYRANAYIVTSDQTSAQLSTGIASSLSSLGLGNLSSGSKGSVNVDKARLKSREFLTSVIKKHNLLPKLFYKKWDEEKKIWKVKKIPTLIDGYELLNSNIAIYGPTPINEIISVTLDWHDPVLASDWTNMLIEEVNLDARTRKKNEIEQSLYFIQEELSKANLSDIKFSLNELIKSQLRENVFANVKKEYSFRFIDHAIPPIKKSSPNRLIIILIGTILSFAITIFYLVIRLITKDNKKINIFTTD